VRLDRLPLTYEECRARFRRAAQVAGLEVIEHPISARGPNDQRLTIDGVWLGAPRPSRVLLNLSGVHGVEGFVSSALQSEWLGRLDPARWPDDMAVVLVHAVNPWGMAWWRRQNEHNVDLNRNWRRDESTPVANEAYDELHALACPDGPSLPDVDELLAAAQALVAERGVAWVRDGITKGQYHHADGLHFGGDRTEESTAIMQRFVAERLAGAERVLTIDLHTGHGPFGQVTFLSDAPPGAPQDEFLRSHFGADRVEATAENPDATTGLKSGQIANGVGQLLPGATCFASSVEFGTRNDLEQLAATYLESWVHRHGDRNDPEHAEVIWRYRCCFTPDDAEWEQMAMAAGRELLDAAVGAVADWC
jgi:hypothetical protein